MSSCPEVTVRWGVDLSDESCAVHLGLRYINTTGFKIYKWRVQYPLRQLSLNNNRGKDWGRLGFQLNVMFYLDAVVITTKQPIFCAIQHSPKRESTNIRVLNFCTTLAENSIKSGSIMAYVYKPFASPMFVFSSQKSHKKHFFALLYWIYAVVFHFFL